MEDEGKGKNNLAQKRTKGGKATKKKTNGSAADKESSIGIIKITWCQHIGPYFLSLCLLCLLETIIIQLAKLDKAWA